MKLKLQQIVVDDVSQLFQIVYWRTKLEVQIKRIETSSMRVVDIDYLRPYFLQTGDYILINFQDRVIPVRCTVVDFFFDAGAHFINLKDQNGNTKPFPVDIVEKDFVEYLT